MNLIQPDLFSELEAAELAERAAAAPCIYSSPARGLAARERAFEAWCAEFDRWDSYARSHAWRPVLHPIVSPGRCQAWTLTASTLPNERCPGHDGLGYKGACLTCDWEGPARAAENEAAEDACDHAFPGWRELPVVEPKPHDAKQLKAWLAKAAQLCPPDWIEAGGPIRTRRAAYGTRSHYAHEWRGWDMCGEIEATQ